MVATPITVSWLLGCSCWGLSEYTPNSRCHAAVTLATDKFGCVYKSVAMALGTQPHNADMHTSSVCVLALLAAAVVAGTSCDVSLTPTTLNSLQVRS